MPEPLAHVYDLALRALEEQERQVAALHSRLAPVLAAGGLGATLLAPAAWRGGHPNGVVETTCVSLGLAGFAIVVLAATYVLIPRRLTFGLDASFAMAFLRRPVATHERDFYLSMTVGLDERRIENVAIIGRLYLACTLMLCGLLLGLCGLAVAAAIA
jgi:hypothetical protein